MESEAAAAAAQGWLADVEDNAQHVAALLVGTGGKCSKCPSTQFKPSYTPFL